MKNKRKKYLRTEKPMNRKASLDAIEEVPEDDGDSVPEKEARTLDRLSAVQEAKALRNEKMLDELHPVLLDVERMVNDDPNAPPTCWREITGLEKSYVVR